MKNKAFGNRIVLQILDYYKNIWALERLAGVAHWDLETYMPVKGANARGKMLAKISSLQQKVFLDKDFVALIHQAEKEKGLTDAERGVVRILLHSLKFYEKIPAEFLEEFEKLTNTATVIWREAKDKNKYELFEPYLTKIFEMNKKMADYLGFKSSPYDALLDLFEEGLTADFVDSFFSDIREPLKNLFVKIKKSDLFNKNNKLEELSYDKAKMAFLNEKVLKIFWPELGQNFRLDTSSHPFTTSFSKNDTRITTWYHGKDFGRSLLAVVHEFGHALYELQSGEELEETPIQGGRSLVIHESQSRFWENFIGRSRSFIKKFLPDIKNVLGREVAFEDVYSYFNNVSPGLIRTEADEVTYHFHIMLRFEIERGIIEGTFKAKDIREIWNSKMNEYLGIKPRKDSDGVLQDIHWSMGSVGYFPTYSLGTFLAAQWAEMMKMEDVKLEMENLAKVQSWLASHVHQYGGMYTLAELLQKNKMQFDSRVNLKFLADKYSKIYKFSPSN